MSPREDAPRNIHKHGNCQRHFQTQ